MRESVNAPNAPRKSRNGANKLAMSDLKAISRHPAVEIVATADVDLNRTAEFRKLLPHVVLYNVEGLGGPYTFRLIGGAVVQFVGKNFTGVGLSAQF